jgi:hypothetical protein
MISKAGFPAVENKLPAVEIIIGCLGKYNFLLWKINRMSRGFRWLFML